VNGSERNRKEKREVDINFKKRERMKQMAVTCVRSLAENTLGVYFDAYRTKAYDGGGEENLTFNGTYCNMGGGESTELMHVPSVPPPPYYNALFQPRRQPVLEFLNNLWGPGTE
jgi:hypothetical protein